MSEFHLAQFNIGRMRTALEDPVMEGFASRLDEINALADGSPGFVWRLQSDDGDATSIRAYDDDLILVNMSVWESVDALREFAYHSRHMELLRDRGRWFEPMAEANLVLWWIPAGRIPAVEEGKERLAHLRAHGPSAAAFNFRKLFSPRDLAAAS